MAVIGKNVIENLTTAMYENNNIIYREYIQNAADQIDKAIANKLISSVEACIDIYIDEKKRCITIHDNATGLAKSKFAKTLSSIADSGKDRNEDKGFRGIGRLGGLACCNTLVFSSSAKGENVKSIMIWNAKKLRDIINDPTQHPTAADLVDMVTSYSEEPCNADEHFFEVKIIEVLSENNELIDQKSVCDYLKAVAPVPYANNFMFRAKIYDYVKNENLKIDEYKILVNGNQIFKGYKTKLYEGTAEKPTPYDSITDLEFRKFYTKNGKLLAWMWFGVTKYEKQIPVINMMRGIRLRKENIQVGNSETISSYPKFFKEPRGNYYFLGEVFAVHKELIPNARRDYFNINAFCRAFEESLKPVLYSELYKLYHYASEVKNALVKKTKYQELKQEFNYKMQSGQFINEDEKRIAAEELEKQEKITQNATRKLDLRNNNANENPVLRRVFNTLESEYKKEDEKALTKVINEKIEKKYMTQSLSKLSKREQKLVSKIYASIKSILPKDMAEIVVTKIQEELSK